MNDTVVFLEFTDETAAYIKACTEVPEKASRNYVIPLSLATRLMLEKNNIPYYSTLSYFDSYAHSRGLVRSEEWLKLVEEYIGDTALAAELCFCLRPLFNYLLWLTEIISNAGEKLQCLRLCSSDGSLPDTCKEWKVDPKERYLGYLVLKYAVAKGKLFTPIAMPAPVPDSTRESAVEAGADTHGHITQPGIYARFVSSLLGRYCRKHQTILLASTGYGLESIMKQAVEGLQRICISDLETEKGCASPRHLTKILLNILKRKFSAETRKHSLPIPLSIFSSLGSQEENDILSIRDKITGLAKQIEGPWRHHFDYRGVDMAPLIIYKLKNGIQSHLEMITDDLRRLERLLTALNPAMVFSPYSGGLYTWLGEMCRQREIPAVMVTHGTHMPPANRMDEIEQWRLSNNLMLSPTYRYTVAQSPWATRHAEYFKWKDRTLNTGPLLFATVNPTEGEMLREKLAIPSDSSIIVYAVTQRKRSSVKFHIFETEDEYLQHMADLVDAVNRLPNAHLILKLHPSSEFSETDIRSVLPSCDRLHVLHQEPFHCVLSAADLLVSYSSTTIEEALLNRIPVVLYDRWKRYCHVEALDCDNTPKEKWPIDAAYYTRTPERLSEVLQHALLNKDTLKKRDDLYRKHLFSSGEYQPLGYHIERFLLNASAGSVT